MDSLENLLNGDELGVAPDAAVTGVDGEEAEFVVFVRSVEESDEMSVDLETIQAALILIQTAINAEIWRQLDLFKEKVDWQASEEDLTAAYGLVRQHLNTGFENALTTEWIRHHAQRRTMDLMGRVSAAVLHVMRTDVWPLVQSQRRGMFARLADAVSQLAVNKSKQGTLLATA